MTQTPAFFADLHVHPTLYGFNRMRNHPEQEGRPDVFHPWHPQPIRPQDKARGQRAMTYTQADFAHLARGRVRLVFASFTPIEKGFFIGSAHGNDHDFLEELFALVTGATLARSLRALSSHGPQEAARQALRILKNDGPARLVLQRLMMKYGLRRLRHILSARYDYWEELLKEYDFLLSRNGQRERSMVDIVDDGHWRTESVEGCYHVVARTEELERIVHHSGDMAVLLTIEGGHVFSVGRDLKPLPLEVMLQRIETLKALPYPFLFLTLAHHFENGLCGHAHSLVDASLMVMDQSQGMYEDFVREGDVGMRVVRALLDLDEALEDGQGRRILIDLRHMSPRARRSYYAEILEPYNRKRTARLAQGPQGLATERPALPVIFSHAGYANARTLEELIAEEGCENDHWYKNPFYAWGLNLCDEDVRQVFYSQGLIGLVLDRRVAGVPPGQKVPPTAWAGIVLNQILAMVDVIWLDDRIAPAHKPRIWDCICLGTDYDGVIDPLDAYPTAMNLGDLATDLRPLLQGLRHTRGIEALGVEAVLEKFAYKNALDFAMRHLPAAMGLPSPQAPPQAASRDSAPPASDPAPRPARARKRQPTGG